MAKIDDAAEAIREHSQYIEPEEFFSNLPSEETVKQWTDSLTSFRAQVTISTEAEADLKEIRQLYFENEDSLEQHAADLDVQSIGQSSPKEVLFMVHIRTLQSQYAGKKNLNSHKFDNIIDGDYSVEGRDVEDRQNREHQEEPVVWIEKSDHSREDRDVDGWGVGDALWCPTSTTSRANISAYTNLKEIEPGDIILLLDQDQRAFTGYARAADSYEKTTCLKGTKWDNEGVSEMDFERGERPAYKVPLGDYLEFQSPLDVDAVLNSEYEKQLLALLESKEHNVVFNKNLNLNQSAYCTDVPEEFVAIIDHVLDENLGERLPLETVDVPDTESTSSTSTPDVTVSELNGFSFTVPDNLYFDDRERIRRQIEAALNSGKNIIFTGPPGTGKTELATALGDTAVDDRNDVDDYVFTTATADWTSFDTIGGYVPSKDGDGIEFQPRIFLNCFREHGLAEGDTGEIVNEWLVIDELNRSDIDKAFGQLFSVLSGDSVELPYRRKNQVEIRWVEDQSELDAIASNPDIFPVTPAWRLIGTMNTYDKASLYEMSYAFMRRFSFIRIPVPDLETEDGVRTDVLDPEGDSNFADVWGLEDVLSRNDLAREMAVLWYKINQHRQIGPSIVMDMLEYVEAYDPAYHTEALTDAVFSLVYPQLEGMLTGDLKRLILSLCDSEPVDSGETVAPSLNEDELRSHAEDFFDIDLSDDDE